MNLNKAKGIIYCHGCVQDYMKPGEMVALNIRKDVYLEGDTVHCLKCDSILGYTWDAPDIFHVSSYNREDEA